MVFLAAVNLTYGSMKQKYKIRRYMIIVGKMGQMAIDGLNRENLFNKV